jgi:hypothetical protein
MDIDLIDYAAGGYFVVKYSDQGFTHSELLPKRVISISRCIGEKLKVYWGWGVLENRQDILDFGIGEEKFPLFESWAKDETNIGFPDVFYLPQAARKFIAAFLDAGPDVMLIGIGLPNKMADGYLTDNSQTVYDPVTHTPRQALYGVNYMLHQRGQVAVGGEVIGFEVVSENVGLSCSWLCSNIEKNMHELFGIRPNQYGLMDSYADAKKVYDWIAEDETGNVRGEPEPYYPITPG